MANSKISELVDGSPAQGADEVPVRRGAGNNKLAVSVIRAYLPLALSAGAASVSAGSVVFSNSNGVTFGLNASTVTASHNGLTSQSDQAFSADGGSSAFQTLHFRNANGLSFSNSDGSVQASYTVPTVPAQFSGGNSNLGNTAGDTGVVTGRLVLVGTNNITLSGSTNGGSMTISISGGAGAAGNTGSISAGTTRATLGEVVFSDSNGMSFGVNGQTVTASYTVPSVPAQTNQTLGVYHLGNTTGESSSSTYDARTLSLRGDGIVSLGWSNGSIRISAVESNQTLGLYAVGNTTGQSSSSTFDARTVSFVGQGIASVGFSNGSVNISVPAGGGGITNINISAGTTSQNLSNLVFSDSNGVSFGLNGSTVTASVNAGGGGITYSGYMPYLANERITEVILQASLKMAPLGAVPNIQFDRLCWYLSYSNATNSTGSVTISAWAGLYTENVSTLSLSESTSSSWAITFSGTVGNQSLQAGFRMATIPWTKTLAASNYWLGLIFRTTTGGANASISNFVVSQGLHPFSGILGQASAGSIQMSRGLGYWTASSTGMPGSVAFSNLTGSNDQTAQRPRLVAFAYGTA